MAATQTKPRKPRRTQTTAAKADPKTETTQAEPVAQAINLGELADAVADILAARIEKRDSPKVGETVMVRPTPVFDEEVPMIVTHVEGELVSGVAVTAYPHRIGDTKPTRAFNLLPEGKDPRTWRWPG